MKNKKKIFDACRAIDEIIHEAQSDLLNSPYNEEEASNIRYFKGALADFQNKFSDYLYHRAEELGKRAAQQDRFYIIREDKELTPYNINTSFREFEDERLALECLERYNKEAEEGKQRLNPEKKKYILYRWNRDSKSIEKHKKNS